MILFGSFRIVLPFREFRFLCCILCFDLDIVVSERFDVAKKKNQVFDFKYSCIFDEMKRKTGCNILINNPVVTILTPMYNASLYLDDCIQSVKSQTYHNWELLLIDDGSTDDSLKKALNWAERDSRIKVLFHNGNVNKGVSATRNLGIREAKGKYIALLDSDDMWLPEKLEKQISILERDPELVLIYCKALTVDQDGVELGKSKNVYNFPHVCGAGPIGRFDDALELSISSQLWIPCLAAIIKANELREIKGFDETLSSQIEDSLMFTVICSKGPIYFINEILCKYRVHPQSYTCSSPWVLGIIEYYDRLYKHLPTKYVPLISFYFDNFLQARFIRFSSLYSFQEKEIKGNLSLLARYKLVCYFYAVLRILNTEKLSIKHKFRLILLLIKNFLRNVEKVPLQIRIVANNFNDQDWQAGVMTKDSSKNMFYFINDAAAEQPVAVGSKLVFARSGSASVTKVDTVQQDGGIAVFVTVDCDLDPAGDGFPNPIFVL